MHLTKASRDKLAIGGLVLATLLLLAVNIFANATFKDSQWDLTEGRLFTLSEGTRCVLKGIDEPIKVRLFFSKVLGDQSPPHATYFKRVQELLGQYVNLAGGRLVLEILDPEPFSDAEDMAVAFGLQGIPINDAGDLGYLGLAAVNSTDDQETIAFLSPDRETFLEYDLTKLIHTLAAPEKKTVGILTPLPLMGGMGPQMGQRPAWTVVEQIRDFFDVVPVVPDTPTVPEDIDILLVVHPKGLKDEMLYSIDQFVLGGGRVLAFVDSNAETAARPGAGNINDPVSEFDRMLEAWGVRLVKDRVAGDLATARRVNVRVGAQVAVSDYVAWLSLTPEYMDPDDVVTGDIRRINLATPGILEPIGGKGTTVKPLMRTSPKSMAIERSKVGIRPNVIGLFREFEPSGKPLILAARITGKAKTAFPDGPPKYDGSKTVSETEHRAEAKDAINVIVVADTDMLHDTLWVDAQDLFGNTLLVPYANNADFVVNALDNLLGSNALIGLRARSQSHRPFHLVQSIRQDAERSYRAKEQELQTKLQGVRARLNKLMRREEITGDIILNEKEKATIDEFRGEMVSIRKELRDVQHAMRRDIEMLGSWLKFANIAAIPLVLGIGILIAVFVRRLHRRATVETD